MTEQHLISEPWRRVKAPAPIPRPLTSERLEDLDDVQLGELLRSHLLPRGSSIGEREEWSDLWDLLAAEQELLERAEDTLEGFLDQCEDAAGLDEAGERRRGRFAEQCEQALDRLLGRPLAWAPERAARYNRAARGDVEQLVAAIAAHRRAVRAGGRPPAGADTTLWGILRYLRLDPDEAHQAPSDAKSPGRPRS